MLLELSPDWQCRHLWLDKWLKFIMLAPLFWYWEFGNIYQFCDHMITLSRIFCRIHNRSRIRTTKCFEQRDVSEPEENKSVYYFSLWAINSEKKALFRKTSYKWTEWQSVILKLHFESTCCVTPVRAISEVDGLVRSQLKKKKIVCANFSMTVSRVISEQHCTCELQLS